MLRLVPSPTLFPYTTLFRSDTAKFGGRVMHFLVKHGYGGRIVPVNPSAKPIRGLTTYASVSDAPGPIDVALLAAPAQHLRSEEHTSELQSRLHLVCRLLLEK